MCIEELEEEARLFSVIPSARRRGNEHELEHKVLSEDQEALLCCVCGVSSLETFKSCLPGHPALSVPA